ncbi:hypothetical protein CEXT_519711 [Caerostris extrusa]|uniref:Maturase K n=1 Tax=Caerostris extrusa TaxID=172846 RepID=A0AAV4RA80_CAEEX|nr:hypothetical protein CEXT_519711 [Caerostris extrusa]
MLRHISSFIEAEGHLFPPNEMKRTKQSDKWKSAKQHASLERQKFPIRLSLLLHSVEKLRKFFYQSHFKSFLMSIGDTRHTRRFV